MADSFSVCGVIDQIHDGEPMGFVRLTVKTRAGEVPLRVFWPPYQRDSYKKDCGCKEVYAVADPNKVRLLLGLPETDSARFICSCFFVEEVANGG